MNWSMPRPLLQVVAGVIGVAALGSFALGVATAPSKGRLPGERANGARSEVLQAVEATPLSQERIEGPPPPPEPTPEELAKLEADKKAKAEADAASRAAASTQAAAEAALPATGPAPTDPIGQVLEKAPPPPPKVEEPPF